MQGLVSFLKGLGASRLMAMVAVTAALIGFFGFVILRVTTPQMTTLYTDLSFEDSSAIIKDLDRQSIPYEIRNDGAVILVPKDKVTRLRMKLAEGGSLQRYYPLSDAARPEYEAWRQANPMKRS